MLRTYDGSHKSTARNERCRPLWDGIATTETASPKAGEPEGPSMPTIAPPEYEVTIITSAEGRRFCKTAVFQEDGSVTKGRPPNFPDKENPSVKMEVRPVRTLDEMAELIEELLDRRDTYPTHARPSDIAPPLGDLAWPRWTNAAKETNHLADAPKAFRIFDLDDVPMSVPGDPVGSIYAALPEWMRGCGMVIAFSASQRPDWGNLKAHVAMMLSKPVTSAEAKRIWEDQIRADVFDEACFRAGQAIYTAVVCKDVTGREIADPLGENRIIIVDGPPVPITTIPAATMKASTLAALPFGSKPVATPTEQRERLGRALAMIGDRRDKDDIRIGFREGLRNLTLTYARLTFGVPRDREWLRQLAIDRCREEGTLLAPCDPEHFELRLGKDFDAHFDGACEKVDSDPVGWVLPEGGIIDDALMEAAGIKLGLVDPPQLGGGELTEIRRTLLNLKPAALEWMQRSPDNAEHARVAAAKAGDTGTETIARLLREAHDARST